MLYNKITTRRQRVSQNQNDRYEAELKRYKFALIILVTVLFVAVFAFVSMIGDISDREPKETTVITTEPPVTEPPVVRIDSMISDTKNGTLIVVNNSNLYTLTDTASLVELKDNAYFRRPLNGMLLLRETVDKLTEMFSVYASDMSAQGTVYTPYINDAYRDYATQEQKYNNAQDKSTAAVAGGSDLHTGYSFLLRFINDGKIYQINSLPLVEDWLKVNMSKYGFIDRYPANGTTDFKGTGIVGYGFYRYVGLPHSLYIDKNGISLEDYVSLLKSSYSVNENPDFELDELLAIDAEDGTYYVMHITATNEKAEFSIPEGSKIHSFSGDNMGGFVVTLVRDEQTPDTQVGDGTDITPAVAPEQ